MGVPPASHLPAHETYRFSAPQSGAPRDESFDVIYCSHVLEHVPADRQAMREFHRVLKKGGWAMLLVPITADRTIEDPSVTDPADRLRLYGPGDHVRRYGPDYVDRLREAGFEVAVTQVSDLIPEDEAVRVGLATSGQIYRCRKEGPSRSA